MRRTCLLAASVAFAVTAAGPALAQTATAFEGGRIILGDERAPIENGTLLVEGNRITQVGRAGDVRVPTGAMRVNLAGKTVMPTINDTHTHLSHTHEAVKVDLTRRAYYGVSAALSLGQDEGDLLGMRNEVIPGAARYLSAGRGITTPEPGCSMTPYWITSEAKGRKAVDELAAEKVDIVKVYVDDWNKRFAKMPSEFYSAIIDQAHKRGLRVTAHIRDIEETKGLLRAGVDAFAHSVRTSDLDDEAMALYKRNPNLVVNPNLPDRGVKEDLTWLRPDMTADEMAELERRNTDRPAQQAAFGIQARNTAKLAAAGIRLVLGTDGNSPWGPHTEMADMVTGAGMTPMQVIIAATRNAAEFLRIADGGTLDPGKSADFIVLDANPLDDITNTRKIAAVYLRGVPVDRSPGHGGGVHENSAICR